MQNLNSIMILLIQRLKLPEYVKNVKFKFHYDSINSMKELEMKEDLNEFKFHYDSINSCSLAKSVYVMYLI